MKYLHDRHSIYKLLTIIVLASLLLAGGGSNAASPDLLVIPVSGETSAPASYYVSTDGSDSNPGSEAQPWQTIQKAVNTLAAGDTVYVRGGQYDAIPDGWVFQHSGTQSRPITFTNYPGEQVVLKYIAADRNDRNIFSCTAYVKDLPTWQTPKADYIRIVGTDVTPQILSNGVQSSKGIVMQGMVAEQSIAIDVTDCDYWEVAGVDFVEVSSGIFTFKANYGTMEEHSTDHWYVHDNRVYIFYRESGMQFDGDDNRIEHNEIYKVTNRVDTPYGCQLLNLLGDHNSVKGNRFSRLGSTAACTGILFEYDLADMNVIEQNRISDVTRGIDIEGGDNNTIRNNIIHAASTPDQWAGGIDIKSFDNWTSWPCTETTAAGAQANMPANNPAHPDYYYYYEPRNCHSYGNQIYSNTIDGFVEGIHLYPLVGENTVVRDNVLAAWTRGAICYYRSSNGTCQPLPGDLVADHNAIQGDFGFADPGSQNFHLTAASSLIDVGYNLGSLNPSDYDGIGRPEGAGYDIGAYEFIAVTISGNVGVPGATVSHDDGTPKTVTADGSGNYSFSVPDGWTGTVTPTKAGYAFTPGQKDYTDVTADLTGQDYAAGESAAVGTLHPAEGSQACRRPAVGVDLVLTDLMRSGGSFDPSSVVLKLDGRDVTGSASITQDGMYPVARASLLYKPTTDLGLGPHLASITYPSTAGPSTVSWGFTVGNTCGTTAANATTGVDSNTKPPVAGEQANQQFSTNRAPEIAALYPAQGSQACLQPSVGVALRLTDLLRQKGSFDPSTVVLKLDGTDVTDLAVITQDERYPVSEATLQYTPTADLAMGHHQASLTYAAASGPMTVSWGFTITAMECAAPGDSPYSPAAPVEKQAP